MTREEKMMDAADAYAEELYKDEPRNFEIEEEICETINDFCAGWRAADNSRWIPVEEELPEVGEKVIFYSPDLDDWLSGAFQQDGTWWNEEYGTHFYGVTHWTPLPEAPQGKEAKND